MDCEAMNLQGNHMYMNVCEGGNNYFYIITSPIVKPKEVFCNKTCYNVIKGN